MAEPTKVKGIEGLRALIGKELAPTDWHTCTFADIEKFADASGDHQWIHVDKARIAKESPFGAPIAHGYFSVARIGGLFFEALQITDVGMVINYGLNKVRFPTPLKEGKRYRLKPQIDAINDIQGGVECIFRCTTEIEGEPKPGCVAECVFRVLAPK